MCSGGDAMNDSRGNIGRTQITASYLPLPTDYFCVHETNIGMQQYNYSNRMFRRNQKNLHSLEYTNVGGAITAEK